MGFFEGFVKGASVVGTDILSKQNEEAAKAELLAKQSSFNIRENRAKIKDEAKAKQEERAAILKQNQAEWDNILGSMAEGATTGTSGLTEGVTISDIQTYKAAYPDKTPQEVIGKIKLDKTRQGPAWAAVDLNRDRNALTAAKEGLVPTGTGGYEKAPVKPAFTEENFAKVGLPKTLIAPVAFRADEESADDLERLKNVNEKELQQVTADTGAAEKYMAQLQNVLPIVVNADTGLISGDVNLVLDRLGAGEGYTARLSSALKNLAMLAKPPGSGSTSDMEYRAYQEAFASLQNPATVNKANIIAFMKYQDKILNKLNFFKSVGAKTLSYDSAAVSAAFDKYYEKNPLLVKDKDGSVITNPNRVGTADWDFETNTPKAGYLGDNEQRSSVGAPLLPMNEDVDILKGLNL